MRKVEIPEEDYSKNKKSRWTEAESRNGLLESLNVELANYGVEIVQGVTASGEETRFFTVEPIFPIAIVDVVEVAVARTKTGVEFYLEKEKVPQVYELQLREAHLMHLIMPIIDKAKEDCKNWNHVSRALNRASALVYG